MLIHNAHPQCWLTMLIHNAGSLALIHPAGEITPALLRMLPPVRYAAALLHGQLFLPLGCCVP